MRRSLLIAVAAALAASSSFAHHPSADVRDHQVDQARRAIVQFVYRKPASFVHVDAPDSSGVSPRWAVEWGGPALAQPA